MSNGFSGSFSSAKVDVMVDTGNPLLNLAVDGFLKIGAVAATKVAAEETYDILIRHGSISTDKLEYSLKRMCREGASWGAVAGVYVGMEYGVERIRGTKDWKNALISGAVTGALLSAASNRNRDKIVFDAIAGGAVATAAEFLNYLT
ncbi:outer envelope pore protein 16, chloroplastic isoform X2 [Primulina tabacum]|uniref:outer envelope pore protein 16, chloroplastic isoform X2 n=1 Tax=Primulina tabacum TaxID=48773 RepID=UPI003F5A5A75